MKKVLLAGILTVLALGLVPAQAEVGNGCYANVDGAPGGYQAGSKCSFTAKAAGAVYVAVTPNSWTIVVTYKDTNGATLERGRVESDSAAPPSTGNVGTLVGDTVTVTMGPDDAAGPVGGSIGLLSVYDAS